VKKCGGQALQTLREVESGGSTLQAAQDRSAAGTRRGGIRAGQRFHHDVAVHNKPDRIGVLPPSRLPQPQARLPYVLQAKGATATLQKPHCSFAASVRCVSCAAGCCNARRRLVASANSWYAQPTRRYQLGQRHGCFPLILSRCLDTTAFALLLPLLHHKAGTLRMTCKAWRTAVDAAVVHVQPPRLAVSFIDSRYPAVTSIDLRRGGDKVLPSPEPRHRMPRRATP
jgi:hypothetical protein